MYPKLDQLPDAQHTYQEDDGTRDTDALDGIWSPRGNIAHVTYQPFCAPAPYDPDNYEIYTGSSQVKLKWAYSSKGYLRAVPGIHAPLLTVDNITRMYEEQFVFTQETKMVISDTYNISTFVSYRVDFNRRSFYLVPVPLRYCPDNFRLTLREATRREVIIEKLNDSNTLYWFGVEVNPFVHLKSMRHPIYALSFEDGESVVMRRAKGGVKTKNFHLEILPHSSPLFPGDHSGIRTLVY